MNNKGQLDYPIITFALVILALIIFAPFALKIFTSIQTPMSNQLGNQTGGAQAQANFNAVMNPLVNMWDKIIIIAFVIAIIMLLISSFFIDTHPVFLILYIFISFLLVLFAPSIIQSADAIYTNSNFTSEVARLTFMDTIRTYYVQFLVGVMIITGIVIYGKIAWFGNSGGSRR
jgi:hypothetical protein